MEAHEVVAIHQGTLDPALALTAKQLRQAHEIVASYSNQLPPDQHHALVAAVLQALATNFHALHTS